MYKRFSGFKCENRLVMDYVYPDLFWVLGLLKIWICKSFWYLSTTGSY